QAQAPVPGRAAPGNARASVEPQARERLVAAGRRESRLGWARGPRAHRCARRGDARAAGVRRVDAERRPHGAEPGPAPRRLGKLLGLADVRASGAKAVRVSPRLASLIAGAASVMVVAAAAHAHS